MNMKIVEISIPEYTLDVQPDYQAVGEKVDTAIGKNFEGRFLARCLSLIDHPQYSLDEFVDVIVRTGTDKYDPNRKGVAHETFGAYDLDLQAGEIIVENGKVVSEPFSEDVRRFYENTLVDRGYRLRIDVVVLYDPEQFIRAKKIDDNHPGTDAHLEEYLWKFKNSSNKPEALKGIIKILR